MPEREFVPFFYGSTARMPPGRQAESDILLIEINPHPIIYSRAFATIQPDRKLNENQAYLEACHEACEAQCPYHRSSGNWVCEKTGSISRVILATKDGSRFDAEQWIEVLIAGLCQPSLY